MRQRPGIFRLNRRSPLFGGLVFAGLGGGCCAKTLKYVDSTDYGNHGTLTNMDPATDWVWVPELGRWGVDFGGDNSGDHVTLSTAKTFANTEPWTFAAWMDVHSIYNYSGAFGNSYVGGQYTRWIIGSAVKGLWNDANGTVELTTAVTGLHHYAMVYSGTSVSVYRDGVLSAGPEALAGPFTFARLGNYGTSGNTDDALDGTMSDAGLWSVAQPLSNIKALADPSNTMLAVGGVPLIEPPLRRWFPSAVAGGYTVPLQYILENSA